MVLRGGGSFRGRGPTTGSSTTRRRQPDHEAVQDGRAQDAARARHLPDGSNSVEAGTSSCWSACRPGGSRSFALATKWMEEKRLYHREEKDDGSSKLVKLDDDLLSASRYAIMMLRKARVVETVNRFGIPTRSGRRQSLTEPAKCYGSTGSSFMVVSSLPRLRLRRRKSSFRPRRPRLRRSTMRSAAGTRKIRTRSRATAAALPFSPARAASPISAA